MFLFGVGVSCRFSYYIVCHLYIRCRGSITSVGKRRLLAYRLLVIVWFLLGGFHGALARLRYFILALPGHSI